MGDRAKPQGALLNLGARRLLPETGGTTPARRGMAVEPEGPVGMNWGVPSGDFSETPGTKHSALQKGLALS